MIKTIPVFSYPQTDTISYTEIDSQIDRYNQLQSQTARYSKLDRQIQFVRQINTVSQIDRYSSLDRYIQLVRQIYTVSQIDRYSQLDRYIQLVRQIDTINEIKCLGLRFDLTNYVYFCSSRREQLKILREKIYEQNFYKGVFTNKGRLNQNLTFRSP